jgi:hypothetical protein
MVDARRQDRQPAPVPEDAGVDVKSRTLGGGHDGMLGDGREGLRGGQGPAV